MKEINNNITDLALDGLDETFTKAFDEVTTYFNDYIVDLLDNKNPDYQQLVTRFEQLIQKQEAGKVNPENLAQNLKKDIEKFLTKYNISKTEMAKHISSIDTSSSSVQDNLFGYLRKTIINNMRMSQQVQINIKKYKTSLAGYYKEQLLVPAFQKVLEQYGYAIKQTGTQVNDKGQQIVYDLIIGGKNIESIGDDTLNSLIKEMEYLTRTSNNSIYEKTNLLGGIQSKSWVTPWAKGIDKAGKNTTFLSFGHRANLMPKGEDANYWHAGVYSVMSNLMEAVGPNNFLFSTGDQVYWTAELLARFRAASYVLAFNWNKTEQKITSSHVVALKHEDI